MNSEPITFYLPQRQLMSDVMRTLDNCYSLYSLEQLVQDVKEWLGSRFVKVEAKEHLGVTEPIETFLNQREWNVRKDYVRLLAFFLSEPYNLHLYYDHFTPAEQAFFRQAFFYRFFDLKNVPSRHYRRSDMPGRARSGFIGRMAWFDNTAFLERGTRPEDEEICGQVPIEIYRFFVPVVFEGCHEADAYVNDIKLNGHQQVCGFESSVQSDFPLAQSLFHSGKCHAGTLKLVPRATMNVFSSLNLPEILPNDFRDKSKHLRAFFLASIASWGESERISTNGNSWFEQLSQSVNSLIQSGNGLFYTLQFHLSFPTRTELDDNNLNRVVDVFNDLLRQSDGSWVVMEKSLMSVFLGLVRNRYSHFVNYYTLRLLQSTVYNVFNLEIVLLLNSTEQLGFAAVYNYAGLLLSLGLVEAVVEPDGKYNVTPLERIKCVRLTALGRYVFGLDKEYVPPKIESVLSDFQVEPDRLIFRIVNQQAPFAALLQNMAESIGNERYRVTPASLMGKATDKVELEARIGMFKKALGGHLTQTWTDFFDNILSHVNPLETVPKKKFVVFHVQPSDTELQRLLSNDKLLRALCHRAEDYYLLVETENLERFKLRLRMLGYLV